VAIANSWSTICWVFFKNKKSHGKKEKEEEEIVSSAP